MAFDPEAYFNALDMNGIRLGLDATRELARRCGDPENELRFIHLAGTNGKGSTGAMLECALRRAGLKTGFYTSPHLVYLRERFRIAGKAVSEARFARATEELVKLADGGRFSYFETATVLAMKLFAEEKCDVVVWETGMGGRLDATNVVTPIASVITNIAFDHMKALGNTLAAIAGEKAGIVKAGVPVFYGVMPDEARQVIEARAAELKSPCIGPGEAEPATAKLVESPDGRVRQCFDYGGHEIELPLLGRMQRRQRQSRLGEMCRRIPCRRRQAAFVRRLPVRRLQLHEDPRLQVHPADRIQRNPDENHRGPPRHRKLDI